MKNLKQRWGISSNLQIILILTVFAINGSLAVRLAVPVTKFFGLQKGITNQWLYWPIRFLLIFPIYQITLIFVAFLFGQKKFFWDLEKKMFSRIGLGILFNKIDSKKGSSKK